jgi:hypothetical protein
MAPVVSRNTEVRFRPAIKLRETVLNTPFAFAVMVALSFAANAATAAMKGALVAPGLMVTLAGTPTLPVLLLSVTTAPPKGAAPLNVAVQEADPGAVTVVTLQLSVLKTIPTDPIVIVPPVPDPGILAAAEFAAITLLTLTAMLPDAPLATEKVNAATCPLAIAVLLTPNATQFVACAWKEQTTFFPAAMDAAPGAAVMFVIAAG